MLNKQTQKNCKITILVLVIIMLVGIVIHSTVLWTINRFLSPTDFTNGTVDYVSAVKTRLSLHQFALLAIGICSTIFLVGNIAMLCFFIKKCPTVAFHKLFVLFFAIVAAMFACVGPFAIADKVFWQDYLFPLWSILPVMVLLFIILISTNLIKHFCVNKL